MKAQKRSYDTMSDAIAFRQRREGQMNQIAIVGYEQGGQCEHCGRALKHCVRISDGRIVGATCLDKKLTLPREYFGKKYRLGAERIVHIAKVVEMVPAHKWGSYGVNSDSTIFQGV